MYLDKNSCNTFLDCEFEVSEKGIRITEKDLGDKGKYITKAKGNWQDFDYLQIYAHSEYASGSVIELFVITEEKEDGSLGGYVYFITDSWTKDKVITLPLKYGIVTRNNPTTDLSTVLGIMVIPFWGGVAPRKAEVFIEKIIPTNEPEDDRERYIACDDNVDYCVSGRKGQKYDVISLLKKNFPEKKHPRLIMSENDFSDLKKGVKDVEFLKNTYNFVKEKADEALDAEKTVHELRDGRRLSRVPCTNIMYLLFAYKISGEEKYFKRLKEDVLALCHYPDWNPSHDIDVGDMSRPVAFAYDWLYDEWTEQEKRIMRNAMMRNGFEAMIAPIRENTGYADCEGNHNTVTVSGLGMLALAIGDEPGCEDISNEVINGAIECLPKNLNTFAPYGVCTEGAGYWAYGQDNFYLLQAAMCMCLGTDFGLGNLPGMDKTADYLIAMHGLNGKPFNYADAHDKDENCLSASLLWLARYYDKKEYSDEYIKNNKMSYLNLLYFKDGMQNMSSDKKKVRDEFFGCLGSMKRGYEQDMLYLGFKGGKIEDHCDLDFGTFVFDALGERFVSELGSDPYDMPGMWEYHKSAGRWSYYRKRAEGNNCIVINPGYDPENLADQSVLSDCNIIDSKSDEDLSYAELDLTSTYPEIAERITRGFYLSDKGMKIKDRILLKAPSEIYSFIHTKADVEILEDKRTAKMTIGEKTLVCKLQTNENLKLLLMDAEPLTEELKNTPHNDNADYRKIAVYGENIKNAEITIIMEELKND